MLSAQQKVNMDLYPSISNMELEEINKFSIENYVQERKLFNDGTEECLVQFGYFGGESYKSTLSDAGKLFVETMKHLTEDDVYFDVGAGDGNALRQYRALYPEGALVAGISFTQPKEKIEDLINRDRTDDKFSFYLGDFKKFPADFFAGRVAVMTDILGAFRYGYDPACIIRQAGIMLKEGGLFFIKYGYADGIKIPEGYTQFKKRDVGGRLMGLWFQTIKGFDVLQEDMTLDESRSFRERIFTHLQDVDLHAFKPYVAVLRRNSDPVEVDTLVADPFFADEECKKTKYWDAWYPNYTWIMSENSRSLIKDMPFYV